MTGLEVVIAQVLEAGRLKQRLLADEARQISQVAGCLLAAARVPRTIHVCADGELWPLAELLASRFRGEGEGLLAPARALPRDLDARQLLAYAKHDEVILVLSADPSSRLGPLLRQAQGQGVQTVGLLTRDTAPLAAYCVAAIVVPSEEIRVVTEVFLSLGHVLAGLVSQGLGQLESSVVPPPVSTTLPKAINRDSQEIDTLRLRPDSEEGELLAKAVGAGYAPPTDPTGRSRRQVPPTNAEVVVPNAEEERFRFRCGACEAVVGVDRRHCGKRGQCPHCKTEFRIPQADFDATSTQRAQAVSRSQAEAHALQEAPARPAPPSRQTARPAPDSGDSERQGSERQGSERQGSERQGSERQGSERQGSERQGSGRQGSGRQGSGRQGSERQGGSRKTTKRRRERRRAPRICVTDALVRLAIEAYPDPASQGYSLDDLSLTGLRYVCAEPNHEIGQLVHLTIDFPAFPLPVRIKGEIRRVIPLEEEGSFGTGIRFVEYVGDAQRQIKRLLDGDKLRGVRRR